MENEFITRTSMEILSLQSQVNSVNQIDDEWMK
jgi:hypothetical protein